MTAAKGADAKVPLGEATGGWGEAKLDVMCVLVTQVLKEIHV